MKRVACYVRVSTAEQRDHGLSVDSQIDALKTFCEEKGYTVAGIYNDAGISARKRYTKRPALLQLLDDCKQKKIDLIIFTKLDRWFRSVGDYYEVQNVLDQCNVPWRAIWEDYETETSSGVFKVNIMLSIAQSEADRTSERIKAVNEFRRAQGDYTNGRAPTGYKAMNSKLFIDEDKREAVSAFFAEYLASFTITKATKALHDRGIKIGTDTAHRMLKNPTYYGDAYGHKCEAYITKEQYDLIQKSIKTVGRKQQKNTYLFSGGLIYCKKCGRAMAGSFRRVQCGQQKKTYKFYVCSGAKAYRCDSKVTITEMKLEAFLVENIDRLFKDYLVEAESISSQSIDFEAERRKLKARLARIGDRYELGDISKDDFISKREAIMFELSQLPDNSTQKKKALPADWRAVYDQLDESHKRAFWFQTLSRIEFDAGSEEPLKIFFN